MHEIPLFQVDAFTDRPFAGNPAAVCPLDDWLPDALLQSIAAENNLSETAFILERPDGDFDLRWFTPAVEVELCGHATLASATVLDRDRVVFHTRSGPLTVVRGEVGYEMDFPATRPRPVTIPGLAEALGVDCADTVQGRDAFVVLPDEAAVRAVQPDFRALGRLDVYAVGVTAPGTDVDFVSRFFAPRAGIDEDPVTGSAHCQLAPLWAERLGRSTLTARQVSARGGEIGCTVKGDRVVLSGQAIVVIEGKLRLLSALL